MSIGSFFKSLKKKITLKGVIHAAEAVPVIGGVIKTAEDALGSSKDQVSAAVNAAKDAATQAAAAATKAAADAASKNANTAAAGAAGRAAAANAADAAASGKELLKNPLVWVGAGLAAILLLKRR